MRPYRIIAGWIVALSVACRAVAYEPNSCFDQPSDTCGESSEEIDRCGRKSGQRKRALFDWGFITGNVPEYEDPADSPLDLDRPDFTEASTTVGRGLSVLEYGYTYTIQDRLNSGHSLPETLLRVGIGADWYEFRIADNLLSQSGNDPINPISAAGLEDLYLCSKFQLFVQDGWLPEAVLIPQMTVPTGHRAFTAGRVLPGINCVYGWGIGDQLGIGASTQFNSIVDDAGATYVEFAQTFVIDIPITERLGMYVEWFGFMPHGAASPNVGPQHYADTGLAFLINDNMQIDVRVGMGLNDHADQFFTGVGGGVRW